MAHESEQKITVSLEGDWSMNGVTHQFQVLQQLVSQLTASGKKPVSQELDLKGITELDACGCQLLSAFVGNLRQQGITPLCNGVTESVCDTFKRMGFDHEFVFVQGFSRKNV